MPVRNIFYANPIYFLIKFRSSPCSQGSLFFPSNTITILLMNLFCTSCSWVETFTAKSASRVRVESFGAVDSSRVIWGCWLESSRVIWGCWLESSQFSYWTRVESLKIATTRVDSSPSQWLDSLQHWVIDILIHWQLRGEIIDHHKKK
jgi:hypothetical protein